MSGDYSQDDMDRLNGAKPRKGGKIPLPPSRDASLPEQRNFLTRAAGLPPEVMVESVERFGRGPADPLMIHLSNGLSLHCDHQGQLQRPSALQAFLASESDGIATPPHLSATEAGDFYIVLCRVGVAGERQDATADLREHLAEFIKIASSLKATLMPHGRYGTLEALSRLRRFDRAAALAFRHQPHDTRPTVVVDPERGDSRFLRAGELVTYLRHLVGRVTDPQGLQAEMREAGCEHHNLQAWNLERSHKLHAVFYEVPPEL